MVPLTIKSNLGSAIEVFVAWLYAKVSAQTYLHL